ELETLSYQIILFGPISADGRQSCVNLPLGPINNGDRIEITYIPYGLENAFIRFGSTELRLAPQMPNPGQKRPNYWGSMNSVAITSNENMLSGLLDICSDNVKIGSGQVDYDDFMISSITVYRTKQIGDQPDSLSDIQKIQYFFEGALGVDAEHIQVSLLEAGLYAGEIDGVWNVETRRAFLDALDWMYSRAGEVDLSNERAFYNFVSATRDIFFDEDSGLARWPTGNSYLLSVMAHQDLNVARENTRMLDQRLTTHGYPNRARTVFTTSGWYVVAAGMYSKFGCEQKANLFKREGLIASDSYCAPENKFMWGD
ncbi:MAG: hypothetical protein P8Q29_11805, partial [Tateyamaria sp.]|nr:hypothetical protein [Tateyamaria sp.]